MAAPGPDARAPIAFKQNIKENNQVRSAAVMSAVPRTGSPSGASQNDSVDSINRFNFSERNVKIPKDSNPFDFSEENVKISKDR
jgi:hypothetical protein